MFLSAPFELVQGRAQASLAALFFSVPQLLNLAALHSLTDPESFDWRFVGLCECIDADNNALARIDLSLVCQRFALDFALRITDLDGANHAAHFIELGKIAERFALKTISQPLDVIGAAQRIHRMGHA